MKKNEYEKMYELEDKHFWFVGKRLFIKTILEKIDKHFFNILDVGAGTGGTTAFLKRFGEVEGVEINSLALSLAKKRGLKIKRGSVNKLPYLDKRFDLVTVLDVLYHKQVKNLQTAFNEIDRVIKPGGYLLVTDSAFNFLKGRHSNEMFEAKRFQIEELSKRLEYKNFKILKASYIFFTIFPLILIKRKFLDIFLDKHSSDVFNPPKILNHLLILLLKLEAVFLKNVRYPFGSSLILLAQKNAKK